MEFFVCFEYLTSFFIVINILNSNGGVCAAYCPLNQKQNFWFLKPISTTYLPMVMVVKKRRTTRGGCVIINSLQMFCFIFLHQNAFMCFVKRENVPNIFWLFHFVPVYNNFFWVCIILYYSRETIPWWYYNRNIRITFMIASACISIQLCTIRYDGFYRC